MSSPYASNSLDDPQFIPGENIGTGDGEPILMPPGLPGETLRIFWELIEQTFESTPEIGLYFVIAVILTVTLVAVGLLAVMSTIRIQRMTGGHGRNETEEIAAYLARNKTAYDQARPGLTRSEDDD